MLLRPLAFASVAVAAAVGAGCGRRGEGTVVVFAASSLTDVFTVIEQRYEAAHEGVDVVVNHGGSSVLAAQIEQGAPADVFAAADRRTAERVAEGRPLVTFARNELAIAVEPGNPLGIDSLADLGRSDLVVVLAAPEVPAGAYAAAALAAAGVDVDADSYEQSVRGVVGKIALGEADAGIVYRTDIEAADGDVDGVAIAADENVIADYPILALSDDAQTREFVRYVLGDEARAVLAAAGFGAP